MRHAPLATTFVDFGRVVCNGDEAFTREWLVTNGLGGYAAGTIGGLRTRRYHALLIAATNGPAARTLLLGECAPCAIYRGVRYPLAASEWSDRSIAPQGHLWLQRFYLEESIPVWQWSFADALLERRLFMVQGHNTVCQHWTLLQASSALELELGILVDRRSHHSLGSVQGATPIISKVERGVSLQWSSTSDDPELSLFVQCDRSVPTPTGVWWHDYHLRDDAARGYDSTDALWHAATLSLVIDPGTTSLLTASTAAQGSVAADAPLDTERARLAALTAANRARGDFPAVRQLLYAGDQFVVTRTRPCGSAGRSILAGYPWFADWSRDAMFSIPGLLLASGRLAEAQLAISTYADFLDHGMLPNRFPDHPTDALEYNAVDAPLLMIEATRRTFALSHDLVWLRSLWAGLQSIITAYTAGARHGIAVDPRDGLLRAGELGVQLTWMDAMIGGRVITPRIGKPVEINAFWQQALRAMTQLALALGESGDEYAAAAQRAQTSFGQFWNPLQSCCFDVIDGPHGNDASIRPNQLFAAACGDALLPVGQRRAIVDVCMTRLRTPQGLRTLDPADRAYRGTYRGTPVERDEAYHQGTVWPWLFAPLIFSHFGVYGDREAIADFMAAFANHLREAGLGTVSEVFSGDPPHEPGGCFAQAWSVAALLEALHELPPTSVDALPPHNTTNGHHT